MSNSTPFDQLTGSQRIALISILSGDSLSRTACLADVTDRTIRRWRRLPVFRRALAVSFRSVVNTAAGRNESDRLKAALYLLDRVSHSEMSAKSVPENSQAP